MKTKLIVALVIFSLLAVTVAGLVAAQVATLTPSPNGTTANGALTGGIFGWMDRCVGFKGASYYGNQSLAYASRHENITVYTPNTGTTTTHQGYSRHGGCGMMRSFYP